LYPLREGESREATLAIKAGDAWQLIRRARVTEDEYKNQKQDRTWTAHFHVEEWDETRTVCIPSVSANRPIA
jgi:hypothetical protein